MNKLRRKINYSTLGRKINESRLGRWFENTDFAKSIEAGLNFPNFANDFKGSSTEEKVYYYLFGALAIPLYPFVSYLSLKLDKRDFPERYRSRSFSLTVNHPSQ